MTTFLIIIAGIFLIIFFVNKNNRDKEEKIKDKKQIADVEREKIKEERNLRIVNEEGKSFFRDNMNPYGMQEKRLTDAAQKFYDQHKDNVRVVKKEDLQTWMTENKVSGSQELIRGYSKFILKSGVIFYNNKISYIVFVPDINFTHEKFWKTLEYDYIEFPSFVVQEDRIIVKDFINMLLNVEKEVNELNEKETNDYAIYNKQLKETLKKDLDLDNDGFIDLPPNEFSRLIDVNQKQITEIDRSYVHQLIKVSNFLKDHKDNLQKIFVNLKNVDNNTHLENFGSQLKEQQKFHEVMLFHAINMVGALLSGNMITFYEIYEEFDKLGIYNSSWQKDVSMELQNINSNLKDISYHMVNVLTQLKDMEQKIVAGIDKLTYVTQNSFTELTKSVETQLSSIDSSIKFNNLLTAVQIYQSYKINKKLN